MPKITELISFEGTLSNSDVFPVVNSSVTKKLPMSALRSNVLTSGSVSSTMLQVDSVTTTKIANGNVTEAKLADGAVTNAKLANQAVNAAKIADLTITGGKLVNATITDVQLAANAVTTAKITDLNVTTGKIADGAVTVAKLDTNAVFAPGTRLVFQQTSAPTGWTKITGINDRALRTVDGAVGSGGSVPFSSLTSYTPSGSVSTSVSGTVGGYSLTVADLPSHTHSYVYQINPAQGFGGIHGGGGFGQAASSDSAFNQGATTGAAGSNQAHNHSWSGSASSSFTGNAANFALQYLDVIVAQKN